MKIQIQKFQKFLVPIIIILIALAVAQGLYYAKNGGGMRAISKDKAAEKAVNYINANFMESGTKAELKSVEESNGVYKIQLSIGSNSYTSYITRDGKIIFPEGMELPEEIVAAGSETQDIPKKDKSVVQLFVMSFCPYGNQAEELMMPVVDLLKDKADIKLHYVIYENYQGGGTDYCMSSGKYCSMHGIQEVHQDVRELCVQKYQGDKFWNFVKQINASCTAQNVDTCWEGVASKTGIDVNKIKTCQANEATTLLKSEVELNTKYGISGSPQLIINDIEFNGNRSAEAFKTAICSGFNTAPSECSTSLGTDSGTTPSGGCQ
jgi:glutaredoxin